MLLAIDMHMHCRPHQAQVQHSCHQAGMQACACANISTAGHRPGAWLCADYKWSLRGLSGPEFEAAQRAVHQRSADRLQRLAFANGGIYIKIGQHIAQLVRGPQRTTSLICQCSKIKEGWQTLHLFWTDGGIRP